MHKSVFLSRPCVIQDDINWANDHHDNVTTKAGTKYTRYAQMTTSPA